MATAFGIALLAGPAAASDPLYPKRVWGGFSGGEMNTSVLVFRDINRNGIYDMGDQPMPNVAVELGKPGGDTHLERTNVSGFANFRMSVVKRDREVTDPGRYTFAVKPPPGWSVTTGNEKQESDYVVTPGAPGDMIARKTTHPVGLAADLTISGTAPAAANVTARGPDGRHRVTQADGEGRFRLPATLGEWQIECAAERRNVTVAQAPVVLAAFSGKAKSDEAPLPVSHVTGFDDLATSGVFEVPSGYGGLDWYNLVAMHQRFTGGPGYINTAMSGDFIAYNSSGHPATVSSRTPFDFTGAYFGAGWEDAEGETLRIKAWRGEEVVYEDEVTLSALGPVYFAADYRRITRIEIRTEHYWQAAMDDFAYRTEK
jgi:hypothetical protein